MSQGTGAHVAQAQKFLDSGENLTQERFTKSRQRKQRSRLIVPPFPNSSAYSSNSFTRTNITSPNKSIEKTSGKN